MLFQDITLIGGLVMLAFSVTGLITAWIDDRFPLRGLAFLALAGVLLWETWESRGRNLTIDDVPLAFMRLVKLVLQQVG